MIARVELGLSALLGTKREENTVDIVRKFSHVQLYTHAHACEGVDRDAGFLEATLQELGRENAGVPSCLVHGPRNSVQVE